MAPSLRVAEKIRPYFVVVLEGGPATAFGLRRVWPDFRSQRCRSVCVDTPLRHSGMPSAGQRCSLPRLRLRLQLQPPQPRPSRTAAPVRPGSPRRRPLPPSSTPPASAPPSSSTRDWRVGITSDLTASSPTFNDSAWAVRDAQPSIGEVPDEDANAPSSSAKPSAGAPTAPPASRAPLRMVSAAHPARSPSRPACSPHRTAGSATHHPRIRLAWPQS